MVERHPERRIDEDAPGPRLAPASPYLGERGRDVAGGGEDDAAEPLRKGAAIIRHPAVIGAVHRHFERHIVPRRPGAEPARGQSQIDFDPFIIHVGDARGRVGIDIGRGLALARDAGEPGHIAARALLLCRGAELPCVASLAFRVGDMAVAPGCAIALPADEPVLLRLTQIGIEDRGVGPDMGIGIEDPAALAFHHSLPYFSRAASGR